MPRTVEAVVDDQGGVRLLEPLGAKAGSRVLVTILDDSPTDTGPPGPADGPPPWTSRYEMVRVVGTGGMSRVHLARDRQTGELVCVKELLARVDRAALQQECRALARLKHPGILRLLNFETRGTSPYLVTEFASGPSLRQCLAAHALVHEPVAALVSQKLFEAIDAAHREEVIHRDLKPENILIQEFEGTLQPKILDFGLAIVDRVDHRNALTGAGLVAGTLHYMAPEQFSGGAVTAACDVYAMGQVCWEMLTGRPAFTGRMPVVLRDKLHRDGLPLESPALGATEAFAQIVRACTRLDPARRMTPRAAADAFRSLAPRLTHQSNLMPMNLGFHARTDQRPARWFDGHGCVDGVSVVFDCRVAHDESTPYARLSRNGGDVRELGVLMQRVPAFHLAGTRVRLRARLRTDQVEGGSGVWLRIDGTGGSLAFDNMNDRWLRGTMPWTDCAIELPVPPGTAWLNLGILQVGNGVTGVTDVSVHVRNRSGTWFPLGFSRAGAQESGGPDTDTLQLS